MLKSMIRILAISALFTLSTSQLAFADIPQNNISAHICTIKATTQTDKIVTIFDGNQWLLSNRPDLSIDNLYIVIFDTFGTSDITDDTIINIVPMD